MNNVVKKIISPFEEFLHTEAASGVILLFCTIVAMILANSPAHETYFGILNTKLGFQIGTYVVHKELLLWINDGLMAIFFFVIGLEIKRELAFGELSNPRKAALPIAAALGGMVVPALIYVAFNHDGDAVAGWGIPMATDIAFAVGILAIVGPRIPFALKIFLLALAIVDDLGAVLVIAIFYTDTIAAPALGIAVGLLGLTYLLNKIGVRKVSVYVVIGMLVWFAVLKSGVHATIAGVILGLMTPVFPWFSRSAAKEQITKLLEEVEQHGMDQRDVFPTSAHDSLAKLGYVVKESAPPLDRLVDILHPWVSFFIMPVFALANAGVRLEGASLNAVFESPIALGVALGLLLGKPIGIVLFSKLAVLAKLAEFPAGVGYTKLIGTGFVAGIGFTMALFISGLAIKSPDLEVYSKLGILMGSVVAGTIGFVILKIATRDR
ncbi:MAG: Na+/H+ antiporter NhaA [Myxococcales bacterium]|nr:Na+/H+ antiporter NhaA [Myxococcales bacterium]